MVALTYGRSSNSSDKYEYARKSWPRPISRAAAQMMLVESRPPESYTPTGTSLLYLSRTESRNVSLIVAGSTWLERSLGSAQ
jgi:hypothetical protein